MRLIRLVLICLMLPAAALAQSFFGRGMEHIGRPVFAHVPRWTSSQHALRFLAPELRAGLAEVVKYGAIRGNSWTENTATYHHSQARAEVGVLVDQPHLLRRITLT